MPTLRTSLDLLEKLRGEYLLFRQNPEDPFVAFNFFATAVHMIKWVHPGPANEARRSALAKEAVILQVCAHVVEGIIQLEPADPGPVALEEQTKRGWFSALRFRRQAEVPTQDRLFVSLRHEAEKFLGKRVGALELGHKALLFWEDYAELKKTDIVSRASAVASL